MSIRQVTRVSCVRYCSVSVKGAACGDQAFIDHHKALHLETTQFQKNLLGFGSALLALGSPWRGDMIAAMGETSGLSAVERVRQRMADSPEGSRVLQQKPRINSSTVDIDKLALLPDQTLGKAYYNFLKKYEYTPDARLAVRFVDDVEQAYVIQRYREVHDIVHVVLDMPTNMLGEVTVKWVEGVQTNWPMCLGGALFGALRLKPKNRREYSTMERPSLDETVKNVTSMRHHPGALNLRHVAIPQHILTPINIILKERNIPNVFEDAVKLSNYLHSRKPPVDDDVVREAKRKFTHEINERVEKKETATDEENELRDKFVCEKVARLMRSRIYHWKPLIMSPAMSHLYLAARAAPEFAAIRRVFNEIHLRDPEFEPKSVFDFGSGVGTVTWATHQLWGATVSEYFTVDHSPDMNDLARLILQGNDPDGDPFVTNLYQRQFLPANARKYDLVVSAFSLMDLESSRTRLDVLSKLWSKTKKYLVLVEMGTNAGFHLINEARDLLLHVTKESQEPCHVFAPCCHDFSCPRITDTTPCNFPVTYTPLQNPNINKRELFSFVILKRGVRNEKSDWPRIVRGVLLRHNHVICRLCKSDGKLDEVILTKKKNGKDTYKCAKYSAWGDLLPIIVEPSKQT